MNNVRTIYADWYGGAIWSSGSGTQLAYQYDHLSDMIIFRNAPKLENYYLIVSMKETEDGEVRTFEPIQLGGSFWLIPNVYTQLVQNISFQVCCKTESGDFEQHSAQFTGTILPSKDHNGAELDVDPSIMYDPYKQWVSDIAMAAGAIVIDPTLSVQGAAADAKAVGDTNARLESLFSKSTSSNWESGTYSPVTGNTYDVSGFSRCSDFISYDDGIDYVQSNVILRIFAYQKNDTFVGIYKIDGTFSPATANEANLKRFTFSDFPEYKFHVVIKSETVSDRETVYFYSNKLSTKLSTVAADVFGSEAIDVTGTVTNGKCYNNTTGAESTALSSAQATDFITIDDSKIYYFSGGVYNWAGGVCFYDKDKNFIGSFLPEETDDAVKIPTGAAYLTASTNNRNTQPVVLTAKPKSIRSIAEENQRDIAALKNNVKINHIYVSPNGSDTDGDGSAPKPFATIYHANEIITDNTESNRYTIHVADGVYTDLQTRFAGTTPSSVNLQGVRCKSYVTYEGNTSNPSACKIVWDGASGYDAEEYTYETYGFYKCPFHVESGKVAIRGFTIEASNTRYAIHIECGGYGLGFDWEISDCIFIWHGTAGCVDRTSSPAAIGTGSGNYEKGHLLRCKISNDSGITVGWMNHDSVNRYPTMAVYEGAEIIIESCVFNGGALRTSIVWRNINGDNNVNGFDRFSVINCIGINSLTYMLSGASTVCKWRANVKCSDITNNDFETQGLIQDFSKFGFTLGVDEDGNVVPTRTDLEDVSEVSF